MSEVRRITFGLPMTLWRALSTKMEANAFLEQLSERVTGFGFGVGEGEDALHRVRPLCSQHRVSARRETKGVYLPGLYALLREDPARVLQGETSHESQEVGAESQ